MHEHRDPRYGWVYRYHSRSDAHSIALCEFILADLLRGCAALHHLALAGEVVFGINTRHSFPNGKRKTLDLAIGTPGEPLVRQPDSIQAGRIDRVLLACEAKAVMTEHGKSKPRVFDELASSHEIVHQGDREAIAAGITVVNIAGTFVSPLRQRGRRLEISSHKQPKAAEGMVQHLRGLPLRDSIDGIGFDAYATIVIDCDNQGPAVLWDAPPAPQPGEPDHYDTFIARLSTAFATRFGSSRG